METESDKNATAPANQDELRALVESLRAELSSVQPLIESARQEINSLAAVRGQAEALLTEIQSKAQDAQTSAAAILAANQQIENAVATSDANSTMISGRRDEVDAWQIEVGLQLTSAKDAAVKADAALAQVNGAVDTAAESLAAIEASKTTGAAAVVAIEDARKQGSTHAATLQSLADKAKDVEGRVAAYELRLDEFAQQAATELENIKGLLPGATSAGLASAFDARRKSFLNPTTGWQKLFIGSIAALIVLAGSGLVQAMWVGSAMGFEDIIRLWLTRLPIAAALVWLAVHSSREAALAKRLEEDYGYKVAIASTFLGFQKQMSDMGGAVEPTSPLGRLCDGTLAIIASPPGRIYERQALTVTPGSQTADAARAFGEAMREATGAKGSTP